MLRRALQRIARTSPVLARRAWNGLPGVVRRRLDPLVFPIALGNRGGKLALEVPPCEKRAYDVVLAPGVALPRSVVAELEAHGQRVVAIVDRNVSALAREKALFDAVLVMGTDGSSELVRAATRLGWRRFAGAAKSASELDGAFPSVAVVVVAFADDGMVKSCLAALERNTGFARLEIVVVDNAGPRGTRLRALARTSERVRYLDGGGNLGFARAVNRGIRATRSELVVVLNDDTVVAPGWLARLVARLEHDRTLGLVCPATNEIGNAARVASAYTTLDGMEAFAIERAFAHAGEFLELERAALFCALARRSTLESIGLLDERYAVGMFEDDDLSEALRERGLRMGVALDAFVHHVGQASFGRLSDAEYLRTWEQNRALFERKWRLRWRPPVAAK